MRSIISLVSALVFAAVSVNAHGYIVTPVARRAGPAFKAACGTAMYNYAVTGWDAEYEEFVRKADSGYNKATCNVFLCKGAFFSDNSDKVQKYTAGQVIPFDVKITVPHHGIANVSVVDTATNLVIGKPLISWTDYTKGSWTPPKAETQFSVTIPTDLGTKCSTAGACVLQWWWLDPAISQTFVDCVDFTA